MKSNMISKSSMNNMPVSPRRVQLVANLIRGRKALESINLLKFDNRKASKYIEKILKSAVANAINKHDVLEKDLVIEDVMIGSGLTLKNRGVPGARGRFKPMKRRTTNIVVKISKVEDLKKSSNSLEKIEGENHE